MNLNYKVFGSGDPVIILHGMFGMLDNWQYVAKKLSDHFMVFILDLRNHGKSPHSADFSYEIMAQDVFNFMEENWIFKAHLIGHSMGGKVAMRLACEHEDRIEKLVVVDIAPKKYTGNHQKIFDALFSINLDQLNSRSEAEDILKNKIESQGVRQFILKNMHINKDSQKYEWKMNLKVIHESYAHILDSDKLENQFNQPTLFVKGADSDYIKREEWDQYIQNFPNAQLHMIPQAGHWVHADQPKEFLEILNNFLLN